MTPELSIESLDAFSLQHASLIAWAYAESKCASWGLPRDAMAEALHRSASKRFRGAGPPSVTAVDEYVRSLHLQDLALAIACSKGIEAAWKFFVGNFREQLYGAARSTLQATRHSDPERARELADSLYAELYGISSSGSAQRKSLFEYFHGRSKLSTWLRAVLAQRLVDQIRSEKRLVSLDSEEDGPPLASIPAVADPLAEPDRGRYLAALDAALSTALIALSPRERMMLSYYYLDERTLCEIGRILREHESTISRQLDRIRRQLRESVTDTLLHDKGPRDGHAAEPGLDKAQVEIAFECALGDWPFDLAKALSNAGTPSGAKE